MELPGDEVLVDESESEGAESSRQVNQSDAFHDPLIWKGSSSPIDTPPGPWSPTVSLPVSDASPEEAQTPARETNASTEHPVSNFFEVKPELSPTTPSRTASLVPGTVSDGVYQVQGALDLLGPLGVYPYSLSNAHDDNESLITSCRPCGPRLFDLVARHSTSDYGLTSWSHLERDGELFELDDIRDEEKAMQALWNRWIFSERR